MAESFTPEPLDDMFTCSVCLEDLTPAMAFPKCQHKICGPCSTQVRGQCPLCRERSEPKPDHTMTAVVEREHGLRKYRCNRCEALVEAGDRDAHRCSVVNKTKRLVEVCRDMTECGAVSQETLGGMVADAIAALPCGTDEELRQQIEESVSKLSAIASKPAASLRAATAPAAGNDPPPHDKQKASRWPNFASPAAAACSTLTRGGMGPIGNGTIVGFGTISVWKADKKTFLFTHVKMEDTGDEILLTANRIRGPPPMNAGPVNPATRVFVIAGPNPSQPQHLSCSAAFPESWDAEIIDDATTGIPEPSRVALSDLVPTLGLARALATPGNVPLHWCKYKLACKKKCGCQFAHRRQCVTTAAPSANDDDHVLVVDGEHVLASRLERTAAIDRYEADPSAVLTTCHFHLQSRCAKGSACMFAHWKGKTRDVIYVEGEFVQVSQLETTAAIKYYEEHVGDTIKWCVHRESCRRGTACRYAHRKLPAAAAATAPPIPAVLTEVLVDGVVVPVKYLEFTAAIDYAKNHPGASLKWCQHHSKVISSCNKGPMCPFAHSSKVAVRVDGKFEPVSQLIVTAGVESFWRRPGTSLEWCRFPTTCKRGTSCPFVHRWR